MEETLCTLLVAFKRAEYKIHVLHTSMQGDLFLSYHGFLDEIYNYLGDQIDEIMENMESLGFDVPTNLSEIIKEEEGEDDSIIELASQQPDIKNQLQIVENTLITLMNITQEVIMKSGSENDYVVQNDVINYQKALRKFERKNRRSMGKK